MTMVGHGPNRGFRVAPQRVVDIRLAANRMRQLFQVDGEKFNAETALERLSIFSVALDVIEDSSLEFVGGVEACWIPDTLTMTIKSSVYIGACRNEPRALFTVAHEFGHLALAHRRVFNRENGLPFKLFEDSEWQANTFAAEFLMPLHLIKKHGIKTADQIVTTFGVSQQAAETRITKLVSKFEI